MRTVYFNPFFCFSLVLLTLSCNNKEEGPSINYELTGSVEKFTDELDQFLDTRQQAEIIATGFEWTEGPVWVEKEKMLLFSDIPNNKIIKWTRKKGTEVYLDKAGYTGDSARGGELGSNGLALNSDGQLVLCQHGNRSVARMDASVAKPVAKFTVLAHSFDDEKFNSPNDLHIDMNGDIYFTDPPYGLEKMMEDPLKEIPYQGVYKLDAKTSDVELITPQISRPNGIALINDGRDMVVANSDPDDARWYLLSKNPEGKFKRKGVFHNAMIALQNDKGLPDGLKWHPAGYLFATGPGGVWILDGEGKLHGKIKTERLTSNCAFDAKYEYLYMTADDDLLRIKLKAS